MKNEFHRHKTLKFYSKQKTNTRQTNKLKKKRPQTKMQTKKSATENQ